MQRTRSLRALFTTLLALVVAAMAAACGASNDAASPAADAPPPIAPETRVRSFFDDFSTALSDPAIGTEETQDAWAGTLAAYALPADQERAKEEIKKALSTFGEGAAQLSEMATAQDLDVRLDMRFVDIQTELLSASGDTATVKLVGGTLNVALVGEDVAALGAAAEGANRSMPVTEFFAQSGSTADAGIPMKLVDNVWYFSDLANGL